MATPNTSWPCAERSAALAEESTPPDMATRTRVVVSPGPGRYPTTPARSTARGRLHRDLEDKAGAGVVAGRRAGLGARGALHRDPATMGLGAAARHRQPQPRAGGAAGILGARGVEEGLEDVGLLGRRHPRSLVVDREAQPPPVALHLDQHLAAVRRE